MIQFNPRYEAIFASGNIDQDYDKITNLMGIEENLIKGTLDAGLYKQA